MIAMEAEDCLRELGVEEVESANSVAGAVAALDRRDFNLAVLDYDLGDETSDAVARRLAERRIPFAVATGYSDLGEHFAQIGAVNVLTKPYSKTDLGDLVAKVANNPAL